MENRDVSLICEVWLVLSIFSARLQTNREKELGRTFAGMDFGYEKGRAIGFKRQLF